MVKQERAARTRQALIRAGAEVFAEEGLTRTSLSTISRRAGVSNGALHFHFENKQALVQAIESQALEAVRQITRDAAARDGGPLQSLVDATFRLMSVIGDDVVVRAGFELSDDPSRGQGPTMRREWQRWVEDVLLRADEDGWLAEGVSADDAATAVVAATVGFEVLSGEDEAWLSEEKVTGFWYLLLPRLTERHALVCVSARESGRGPKTPHNRRRGLSASTVDTGPVDPLATLPAGKDPAKADIESR
ncbi:ScbR family autoregulator-binding transcription factor [Streptomyces sp. ALI-76-A]|uniref:ScbR family autoregulator-binding transcription factor n=1 Tax=Streptomyces sp. ALI-76-A TaxID=3025736 RepID=UPI00256EF804|nr:ScbR family autoregulator-binding transcription factor [Streptomyces sp. ALI-76-A]MDL5205381.1 ScbR family autoregulator-binding transcription factor [Streptomyces sp. ALI-76-A]